MTPQRLGVAGAGTMGAGIAQLGCLAGLETTLFDPVETALSRGTEVVARDLERGSARGRWSQGEAAAARRRLVPATDLEALAGCEVVIEAAPERLELKRELFGRLEGVCAPDAVLATNTSSLEVAAIASACERPQRVCGMHFFNPPPLMRLVEVVAAPATAATTLATATEMAERMGRTPIRCADSPGFIVNRCNRPFALEALQMLGEGVASAAEIDLVMREDGGYRMGPFELVDLIGVDVNLEVARSFYAQRPVARWRPHPLQERMVADGLLGRKSGRGFYRYDERGHKLAEPAEPSPDLRREVLERTLCALVNEACFAREEKVAGAAEIDRAMKLGLNHPRGPFEWGEHLGPERVVAVLEGLAARDAERYRPASALREWARSAQPP